MKKILIFILIIFTVGCSKNNNEKIYLEEKYYEESKFTPISINDLKKENYVVYIYNNYCSLKIPCDTIFKKVMDKYNLTFLSLPFEETKKTFIYSKVKYAPSIVVISSNKIVAYLDVNSDEDYSKYQNEKDFEKWLSKYIYLEKKQN